MRNKRNVGVIVAAVVVIVAIIIAAVTFAGNGDESPSTDNPDTTEQAPGEPTADTPNEGSSAQGFDSPTVDFLGRKVLTPRNGVGVPRGNLRQTEDVCAQKESAAAGIEMQATEPTTLWSKSDGPASVESGAPTGYSRTVQGASVAAWNYYSVMYRNDASAEWIAKNRVDMSESDRDALVKDIQQAGGPVEPAMKQVPPVAYRVTSCSDDYVVLDYAKPAGDPSSGRSQGYNALRLAVVWKNDDWNVQLDALKGSADNVDIEGWTQWSF